MHNNRYDPHTPRQDWRATAAVAVVGGAVLLLGFVLYWLIEGIRHWADPYADPLLPPWFVNGALILLLAAPALWLYGVYTRWASRPAAYSDKVVALERARRAIPDGVISLSYHDSHKALPVPEVEAPMLPPATVPSFAALLDQGAIGAAADGRRQPLILAYRADTGAAIEGSWKDLYSTGIGALQGAGKSWLEVFLLSQSALNGAKLVICDPHAGHDSESLAARVAPLRGAFLCDVAQTDAEILDALRLANDELERRKAGKGSEWPLIVAVDEWTSLLRGELGELLPDFATNFAEQGRKFNVNCILSAQGWTKDAAGLVRNRLTSHYILRQRPDEARYQTGLRAAQLPPDIRTLPDATGYLLTVRGDFVKVVIPKMTPADLEIVGAELGTGAGSGTRPFGFRPPSKDTPRNPAGTQTEPSRNPAEPAPEAEIITSAEIARILALFDEGLDTPEIIRRIWPDLSRGRATQERSRQVLAVIRRHWRAA